MLIIWCRLCMLRCAKQWILSFFFGVGSINYKVPMAKIWYKLILFQDQSFCMFKTFKSYMLILFFQVCSNMHNSFSNLERVLILMVKRTIGLETNEIHLYNTFWHFWFKSIFDLEIYVQIFQWKFAHWCIYVQRAIFHQTFFKV